MSKSGYSVENDILIENEQLRFALEAAGIGTWDYNLVTGKVQWSGICKQLFGLPADANVSAAILLAQVHPDDRERVAQANAQSLNPLNTQEHNITFRTLNADGSLRWVQARGKTIRDEQGQMIRFSGIVQEVTQAILAQQQIEQSQQVLTQSEMRQTLLLKLSDALRPLVDPVEVQDQAARLLGEHLQVERCFYVEVDKARENLVVHRDYVRGSVPSVVGTHPLSALPWLHQMMETGQPAVVTDVNDLSQVSASDRDYCLSVGVVAYISIPVSKAGAFVGMLGMTEGQPRAWKPQEVELAAEVAERTWEAMERARTEEALRNSEEAYRILFESIDEGFSTIEVQFDADEKPTDYRFLDVNPAFDKQTDILNAPGQWMRQIAPAHEQYWFDTYGRVAKTGKSERFEAQAAALHRWYDVYAFRIGKPGENKVGVLFNDITERKKSEQALQESENRYRTLSQELEDRIQQRTQELVQANQDLKRSNENLQQFAYVASHDLQEPLRKIQSFSNLLGQQFGDQLGESGLDFLERMQTAGERMSMLIRDLLTYSRVSTRQQEFGRVSLNDILRKVRQNLEFQIEQTNAQLEVDDLPTLKGDESQLSQLFQNLLSNALKFTRPGEAPRIQIVTKRVLARNLPPTVKPTGTADAFHQICVIDQGIGFDNKYQQRIFQLFQRLHGRSEYSGTGIGLAICQRVAENHGGTISAHGEPGKGATFCVYLPQ